MGCHRPLGCPLCGSWEIKKVDVESKKDDPFSVYMICKKCGTKYTLPELD
jgi:transcription elongation factor Elf1